ncbi:Mu-like prophage I protein [Komagataeibacter diospyri]|uniref:phage protease n=1 Tax=Komagataeibacter diospyri TaxID=1932662 RepID=UPI00113D1BE4|nr:phage protease [Komagataeibacter diospyri]GCE88835.1 Mu-like prophage I protein [Komagataeibacter diospyri]
MTTQSQLLELPVTGKNVPDWIHLVPAGTFTGEDGRGPYTLSDPAGVISRSLPEGGRPIPLDYNHAAHHAAATGAPAPAAGWITQLESRENGIWGKVEWTANGRKAVAAREYRFISPGLRTDPNKHVAAIMSAALCNMPNFGELTHLNARKSHDAASIPDARLEHFLGRICQILKMPPASTDEQVLVAIEKLASFQHNHTPAAAQEQPSGDLYTHHAFEDRSNTEGRLNRLLGITSPDIR